MGLFSIHNINPLNDDPRSFLYCTEKGELIKSHSAALKMAQEMQDPLSKNLKTFVSFSNPLAPGSGLANKTTVHSQI